MRSATTPWIILAGVLWLLLFGPHCAQAQNDPAAPISVVVTIAPLKGLVERLAPAGSTVRVLMPPGRSEHGYEFTPADLAALGRADVSIRVGLGLEPKVEEFVKKRPGKARIDLSFAERVGILGHDHEDHEGHDHAHDEHEHAIDPHLWLDPSLVEAFVPHIAKALREASARKHPLTEAETEALAAKERGLLAEVRAVDTAWRERLAPFKGRAIVTHHNAFPRPAERYALRVAAVIRGLENAEPKPSALESVVKAIRDEGVHAVFVEPQFNAGLAERIAKAAGVKVARLDPLGDGDWFKLMSTNLESLAANLGNPATEAPIPAKPSAETPPK